MNKMILGLAAAAATLTAAAAIPTVASAQPYLTFSYSTGPAYGSGYGSSYGRVYQPAYGYGQSYGYGAGYNSYSRLRDSDRDGIPDRAEWNQDRDRDGRLDQYDAYDNRRDRYDRPTWSRRSPPIYGGYGNSYGYNGYGHR